MTTGQRIKEARKRAGMTQKELALKLGIPFQGISQWENDLRNPKYETLRRIADALGCDWLELVTPEEGAQAIIDHIEIKAKAETPKCFRLDHSLGTTVAGKSNLINALLNKDSKAPQHRVAAAWDKLNEEGQEKAADAVELIAEIPRYCVENAPQSAQEPKEDTDTTPPSDVPETPPEGK